MARPVLFEGAANAGACTLVPHDAPSAGEIQMMIVRTAALLGLCLLTACGQGGRLPAAEGRAANETQPQPAEPGATNIIIDPVAALVQPVGLAYKVETTLGTGPDAIRRVAFGIDGIPVRVDVDGDSSTGGPLGGDIQVHFFTLLLYARLQVDRVDGAAAELPLQVDVSVLDPRNLLGLPGLLGLVDPRLRVALGVDARASTLPQRFSSELSIFDSLLSFLPRFTSAQLDIRSSADVDEVAALLATFTEQGEGVRADTLELRTGFSPAVAEALIDVELAPDAENSSLGLESSAPTDLDVAVRTTDGLSEDPTGERTVGVRLPQLQGRLDVLLEGVDGLDSLDDVDTVYDIQTQEPLASLQVDIGDRSDADFGRSVVIVKPLPTQLKITRTAEEAFVVDTSAPVDDLAYAQTRNTALVWSPDTDPTQPFTEHVLRQTQRADGTEQLLARLAGLSSVSLEFEPDLQLRGSLSTAPLQYREETSFGFTEARIELLPGEFSIQFPQADGNLLFAYKADAAGPGLRYQSQDAEQTTQANIRPLPAQFSLCTASDDRCASHGRSTDASIAFSASESMVVNYQQRSQDGQQEIAVNDLRVENLVVDAGTRSGSSRGYVYFDTQGDAFGGTVLQRNGDSGIYLSFSEGTFARERVVRYKNFIEIDERSGKMQCPGREELEIRSGGLWFDFGFLLDQLCQ